ncbi:cupredoxin domain-containing protein [Pyxidicoccus xibeiensis]|uniref:cupredoxin domain-containing protein n=1 Tax=Pyxidicoccus xibeiensis TaxID=2906759 RepID=UPI0020A79AA7|nr:cupredoxin domain-containing protein [Pyxidicoccus xibeiensis]MCP3135761.1 cupredoxin domain-containing protein [Pyxidicoccus xibeiensis]
MGKRIIAVVMAAGLVAACSKKDAPAEAPAPSATQAKPHDEAVPHSHDGTAPHAHAAAQPHAHISPHGGLVESTQRGHMELVATRGGSYRVYLLDEDLNVRPVEGASGSVKVAKSGYPDVKLAPAGDHLAGQGPEHSDEHLTMVVTVVVGGKPEVARFAAHLEAHGHGPAGTSAPTMQAHDHTPLHGGIVAMSGETHLEVLSLRSGEVRVWVTDAFRRPVSLEGKKGTVEVAGTSAPLVPSGEFLTGRLPPAEGEREVTVRLPMPDDPEYFIGFLLTPVDAPKAPTTAAAKDGAVQEVTITVQGGYQPSEVTLKQGVPARLRFVRKDSGGCGDVLRIPDFSIQQPLPGLTETVVAFVPDKVGTFTFTCGMEMMKGTLVVR